MRRIRVISSDPYATDSSSEEEESEEEAWEEEESSESPPKPYRNLNTNEKVVKNLETKEKVAVTKNRKSPYPGVRLRPSGRWTSEIRSRVTGIRIYLGTFDTAEAAYEAYCAKKLKFDGKVAMEKIKKNPYPGVHLDRGHWRSEIRFGGNRFNLGRFDTAEAAHEAYCAKRRELGEKVELSKKQKAASNGEVSSEEIKSKQAPETCVRKKLEVNENVVLEKNKKNPYVGVRLDRGHWRSNIYFGGNHFYLGSFKTAEAAHEAYCEKKRELEEKAELSKNGKAASGGKVSSKEVKSKQAPEACIRKKLEPSEEVVMEEKKKSSYVGVRFDRGRWRSEIRCGGKRLHLGRFETAEAAHEAYCAKKREIEEKAGFNKKYKKNPYLGAHVDRGRWRSEIRFGGKRFNLGQFETAEEAHEAYCAKKRELEEKAESSKNLKATSDEDTDPIASDEDTDPMTASDEDTDPICYNLRTRKRAFYDDSSSCESDSFIGNCRSDKRVKKKTKMPLVGTSRSEEVFSSADFTNSLNSQFSHSNEIESEASDLKSTAEWDTEFVEKSMLGEKAGSKDVEKAAFDYGYGSIPREMASLIIDDNGFLLGEYSQIDDLSIF